jgi:hypothetical protein
MDKTKTIISSHQDSHTEFKYYFSIIQIAEESINENPDVTIDCCKALIEGVSKSILIRLDNNYNKNNNLVDGVKALKLFDKAIKLISKYDQSLIGKETDFLSKSRELVETIINIRNDRGDISHGKFTPKPSEIVSTSEFALFVINMTDSIVSFMLKVFFEIKVPSSGVLDYDSEDMEAYNFWLDESVEFPIKKAKYSKLLYENDYDEYESRYSDEYLVTKEGETDKEPVKSAEATEENEAVDTTQQEEKEGAIAIALEKDTTAEQEEREVEKLVSNFDEDTFWSEAKNQALQEFSETESLKIDVLKEVINDFLFSEKPPLRDNVAKTMNERPKLSEFKTVVSSLTEKIMAFANDLKHPEAEA